MKRTLLSLLGLAALVPILAFLYFWSFRTAHIAHHPSGDYTLSIGGIKVAYTAERDAMVSRFYAPLLRRQLARQPKREVDGTIAEIDWASRRVTISAPHGQGALCHFDERFSGLLQTLQDGDPIHATIGMTPGKSFVASELILDGLVVLGPQASSGLGGQAE